jgi:hypothetical protein
MPSAEYKERARPIIEAQVVKAGRRLADLMVNIFDARDFRASLFLQ